jgi:endonuclease YncB( thermonuclease family)
MLVTVRVEGYAMPFEDRSAQKFTGHELLAMLAHVEEYPAVLSKHVDADSTWVVRSLGGSVVDYPHGLFIRTEAKQTVEIRYAGINAPELSTDAGKAALTYLKTKITSTTQFAVRTANDRDDKYGRLLGWIMLPDGKCLNRMLVDAGHAVPFGDLPVDAPEITP